MVAILDANQQLGQDVENLVQNRVNRAQDGAATVRLGEGNRAAKRMCGGHGQKMCARTARIFACG